MADKAAYRKLGEKRLEVARKAKTKEEWDKLWTQTKHPYSFELGPCWKNCMEYKVADFAAELGFFVDILGFVPNALGEDYAMFTSPDGDFYFSIVPAGDGEPTPKDALRIQFMLQDIHKVTRDLKSRGIEFEKDPEPASEGSPMLSGTFRTPNGIPVDLWGMVEDYES